MSFSPHDTQNKLIIAHPNNKQHHQNEQQSPLSPLPADCLIVKKMAGLGNFNLVIVPGLDDPIVDDALLQFQARGFARLVDVFGLDQPIKIHNLRRGIIEASGSSGLCDHHWCN